MACKTWRNAGMEPHQWILGVLSPLLAASLARAAEDQPPAQPWPLRDGSESIAA